ncbi:MAG TPA: pseudaminic acid cytidylyltransferase [Saprospiraceae bacterium]|nr:pseudaminic acid cytidylyltransferase [Saprospiraceae bacterium]
MKKIAIIPARGGSKRIPRKNIKDFLGKPIIAYSIQTALDCALFDEVMVSTDDEEIAEIAKKHGATVPFMRSTQNANDHASTVDVLLEVINDYKQRSQEFELGCCIYPTAPFVSTNLLQQAHDKLTEAQYDTVFPVLPFSFPIQRAVKINREARLQMFQPEHLTTRSQDLEKAYHDAGQFYWFQVDVLQEKQKLWTNNTGGVLLHEMQAHDIDTPEDWEVAEFKFKLATNG